MNKLLDDLSEFLVHRKGLLPALGILFVLLNFILQLFPGEGWLIRTNMFLHLGIITAFLGFMIAWVL